MINSRALLISSILLAAGALAGCAVETAPAATESIVSSEGALTLRETSPGRLAGVFRRGDIGLEFEVARAAEGSSVVLTALDGTELIRQVASGEANTSSIMNGKLVVSAPRAGATGSPSLEGDPKAIDEMTARPEYALLPSLGEALVRAGIVDTELGESVLTPQRIKIERAPPSGGEDEGGRSNGTIGGAKKDGCGTVSKVLCSGFIATCAAAGASGVGAPAVVLCLLTVASSCISCLE